MHLLLLTFFLVLNKVRCCEKDLSTYSVSETREEIARCKETILPFDCVDGLKVRAANLLMNFGLSVGFLEKDGHKQKVSPEAHAVFNECTKSLLNQMPDEFGLHVRTVMNVESYDERCWDKAEICRLNRQYLFPFVCLARQKCSVYLADAFYALVYANQMLSLETNENLHCDSDGDSELKNSLFVSGMKFHRNSVLNRRFCRNVTLPPRKTLVESTMDGLSIFVAYDYYWP